MNRADYVAAYPDFPWLDFQDIAAVAQFLKQRQWLDSDERVLDCGRAGDGNMNLTIRVRTNHRSVVVKQARPWVEKYDHIEAPWNRVDFERRFYTRAASLPDVASRMPKLLAWDEKARTLMLEFIDGADDFTALYSGVKLEDTVVTELAKYIAALHRGTARADNNSFANTDMRKLNHAHIFEVPLQAENGVQLGQFEPGLEVRASELRSDDAYRAEVELLGRQYLEPGTCLIHGDYFPGSWLGSPQGLFVIDPEFCFVGTPEIDLGCTIAHMALAKQDVEHARALLKKYAFSYSDISLDSGQIGRFAAVEVMRRLIGVAQLPIPASSTWRSELLWRSRSAMHDSSWELLWT